MAIVNDINPVQRVSCDLCGIEFDRAIDVESNLSLSRDPFEDVSITIWPQVGKRHSYRGKGYIKIEHACSSCRDLFVVKITELISGMKKI